MERPKPSSGGVESNGTVHHQHGTIQQGRYDVASEITNIVFNQGGSYGGDDPRSQAAAANASQTAGGKGD